MSLRGRVVGFATGCGNGDCGGLLFDGGNCGLKVGAIGLGG